MKAILFSLLALAATTAFAQDPAWRPMDGAVHGGLILGTVAIDAVTTPTAGAQYGLRVEDQATGRYVDTALTMTDATHGAVALDTGQRRDANLRLWLLVQDQGSTQTLAYSVASVASKDPLRYLFSLEPAAALKALTLTAQARGLSDAQIGQMADLLREAGWTAYQASIGRAVQGASEVNAALRRGVPTRAPTTKPESPRDVRPGRDR